MELPKLSDYVEKQLFSKRFILALLLVVLFAQGHISEGLVGAAIGFYFNRPTTTPPTEGQG